MPRSMDSVKFLAFVGDGVADFSLVVDLVGGVSFVVGVVSIVVGGASLDVGGVLCSIGRAISGNSGSIGMSCL